MNKIRLHKKKYLFNDFKFWKILIICKLLNNKTNKNAVCEKIKMSQLLFYKI